MTAHDIGYFWLIDAFAQGGCPVCRRLEEDGRRHLDALLYEQVTDPDTRRRLRASWGFCNWHASMLLEIENSASGAAILCEDVMGVILQRFERLRDRARPGARGLWLDWLSSVRGRLPPAIAVLYRRRPACPVCAWSVEAEERYIASMQRFIDDPHFDRAYARSEGLCVPHVLQAIEQGAGTPQIALLIDRTLAKWRNLRNDLDRFVAKHDYRNREAFTEAEALSPRRAVELLSGRPGLYSNDLRGEPGRSLRRVTGAAHEPAHEPAENEPGGDEALERGQIETRVKELTDRLDTATSRVVALHDRLAQVAEDRDVLEMNLTSERGANELAISELRAENARLRAELLSARPEAVSEPRAGG